MLIATYHIMAAPDGVYHELGGDYFASRGDSERRRVGLVKQLPNLGCQIALTLAVATG